MSDFDILPEEPILPKPALESRVRLLEGRVSSLEMWQLRVERLVAEVREGLRADIVAGIDRINLVLMETQKVQRRREADEKALVGLCEETLAAVRDLKPKEQG